MDVILNRILIHEFFEVFFLQPPDTWLKRASDCMIAINNLCWHSSDSPHSDLTNFRTLQTGAHKNHLCRVVSSERSRMVTYFNFILHGNYTNVLVHLIYNKQVPKTPEYKNRTMSEGEEAKPLRYVSCNATVWEKIQRGSSHGPPAGTVQIWLIK